MPEKKEYLEFKRLLIKAIGNCSQREFAQRCEMSFEHLNRCLKNDVISRPSKKTLMKICNASDGRVSAKELYTACGYDINDMYRELRLSRSKMTVYERMNVVSNDLVAYTKELISETRIYNNWEEFIWAFLSMYKVENLTFVGGAEAKEANIAEKKGEMYKSFTVKWSMTKDDYTKYNVMHEIAIFFVITSGGKILITDIAVEPYILDKLGLVPDFFVNEFLKEYETLHDVPFFATCCESKYKDKSPERILLDKIFGDEENQIRLPHSYYGYGFIYDGVPKNFINFLLAHKETFCKSEEETELYEEVINADLSDRSYIEKIFSTYDMISNNGNKYGVARAIVNIINRELYDKGLPHIVSFDTSDNEFGEVLKPVIAIDDEYIDMENGKIKKESVKIREEIMNQYAKELMMPSVGTTLHISYIPLDLHAFQEHIKYDNDDDMSFLE